MTQLDTIKQIYNRRFRMNDISQNRKEFLIDVVREQCTESQIETLLYDGKARFTLT